MSKPLSADHVLLELPVLFSEGVKVDGAPDAGALPADHNDGGRVDRQERSGPSAALYTMADRFIVA